MQKYKFSNPASVVVVSLSAADDRDPRKELYVSLIEFDVLTMTQYQAETGHYGDLYAYKWAKENAPELADRMRRYETRSDEK